MFKTIFTTRLWKNLLLSINLARSDNINISHDNDCEDEIVKKSPFIPKYLNKAINYLTLDAKKTFT